MVGALRVVRGVCDKSAHDIGALVFGALVREHAGEVVITHDAEIRCARTSRGSVRSPARAESLPRLPSGLGAQ